MQTAEPEPVSAEPVSAEHVSAEHVSVEHASGEPVSAELELGVQHGDGVVQTPTCWLASSPHYLASALHTLSDA